MTTPQALSRRNQAEALIKEAQGHVQYNDYSRIISLIRHIDNHLGDILPIPMQPLMKAKAASKYQRGDRRQSEVQMHLASARKAILQDIP